MSETFPYPLIPDDFPLLHAGVIELDHCAMHNQIYNFGDECTECAAQNAHTLKALSERQKRVQEVRSYSETKKVLQSQQEARTGQAEEGMDWQWQWRTVLSILIPLSFLVGVLYDVWKVYHR